jgi:DNA-binding SARP family transcriptional activator
MLNQYKTYISQFVEHPSFIKSSDKKFKNWVNTQRQYYRDNLLSERRIEELKKIGFIFSPKANQEHNSED